MEEEIIKRLAMTMKSQGMPSSTWESNIKHQDFIYVLVELDIALVEQAAYLHLASDIFKMVIETDGDVSQFLGNIVLGLYGVPIEISSLGVRLSKLARELLSKSQNLRVIFGKDFGLVGLFGNKERKIGTAVGPKMARDVATLASLKRGTIYVHNHLIQSFPELKRSNPRIVPF